MADTRYLKSIVEDNVRAWLKDRFDQPFTSMFLQLIGVDGTARTHEFDAVSEDGAIVCSIKTASCRFESSKVLNFALVKPSPPKSIHDDEDGLLRSS